MDDLGHAETEGGCGMKLSWQTCLRAGLTAAMLLLGAEGDSNHVNRFLPKGTVTKGTEYAKRMARILSGEVLKIYDSATDISCDGIRGFAKDVQIGKNPYDPADIPEARKIRELYLQIGKKETEAMGFKLNVPEALRILANLDRP